MGPGFLQLQGLLPCIFASSSGFLGSSFPMLSLTMLADLPPMQPRQGHAFCFGGICHALVTGPSCFSHLSQRRSSICPYWFQRLLSPGLLPPPWWEMKGTAFVKARCHALNGGDGKKCLTVTVVSFSSSLYNLVDLNRHWIPLPSKNNNVWHADEALIFW